MTIQLKNPGTLNAANTRWRTVLFFSFFLVLVFFGLYSQGQGQHEHQQHPTSTSSSSAPKKLHSSHGSSTLDMGSGYDRPLILYAYAESENARENFKFFLQRGLHSGADFVFIFNGETDAAELVPSHLENVRVVQRDNTCYDMGAFGEVLTKDDLWLRYKRFITLNASVRGPFLPMWSKECWTDAFLDKVTEKNKLVGLTYQCIPNPHVQSMLLATDHIGMKILLDPDLAYSVPLDTPPWGGPELPVGYSICYADYGKAVHSEIGISRLIRAQGYEVDVMLTSFRSATSPASYCDIAGTEFDTLQEGGYFGSNIHPYELIFAKANRNIDDNLLEHLTAWHYAMNETSWETCSRHVDGSR